MMNVKKKRLGRGLDALLSRPPAVDDFERREPAAAETLRQIPVELLERGEYQPRNDIRQDSLEDLASSIRAQGVVQPIVARPLPAEGGGERYEIIAGERRWRAAQMAGLDTIPTVVRNVGDEAVLAMALIENIQRENLNPLEEARALKRLITDFDLTHAEAADAVGRSRAAVSNLLRLMELSDRVKAMLEARELEMGHARALLAISDPGRQVEAAREIAAKGLSVREAERLVKRVNEAPARAGAARSPAQPDADIRRLETDLTDRLGAKVRIDHSAKGFGKLVIAYNTLDELEGILDHIH